MTHPGLTDIVLGAMLNSRGTSPYDVSMIIQRDKDLVKIVMDQLKVDRKFWFEHMKGFGEHEYHMIIKEEYKSGIKEFLKDGGFSNGAMEAGAKAKQRLKDEVEERELRTVTIAQAKKAMEDSDKALEIAVKSEQASRESIVIAHESNVIAKEAKSASFWAGLIGAAIGSVVMWLLTKYFP